MAAQKYLVIDNTTGLVKEASALDVASGAGDSGQLIALDAQGKIPVGFLPSGIGQDTLVAPASEAISAGAMLNLWYDSANTTVKWRNADKATAGGAKEAHAFANAAVTSGSNCTGIFEGRVTGLTGLTPGGRCWLGNNGAITQTPTTTAGESLQRLGIAVSATTMDFEKSEPIIRA